jgi:hypothetical protein
LGRKPERKRILAKPAPGGSIILNWILEGIGLDGIDWIDLPKDREWRRALVNTVMNLPDNFIENS